jgi:ABC-type multidrug transport system fused ATPase/permease subunit
MRQTWGHIRELVAYALKTLPGHSWKLPAVAVLGLAELALAVLSPLLTLQIINSLVTGELAQFRGALLKLGLCLCGQAVVNVSHQMAMLILDENVGTGMRKQTLQFVLSQPAAFFDRYWAGS